MTTTYRYHQNRKIYSNERFRYILRSTDVLAAVHGFDCVYARSYIVHIHPLLAFVATENAAAN